MLYVGIHLCTVHFSESVLPLMTCALLLGTVSMGEQC